MVDTLATLIDSHFVAFAQLRDIAVANGALQMLDMVTTEDHARLVTAKIMRLTITAPCLQTRIFQCAIELISSTYPPVRKSLASTFEVADTAHAAPLHCAYARILDEPWNASETIKSLCVTDPAVVALAVFVDPMALEFASETLKDHKLLVSMAVRQDPAAIDYASPCLQWDRDVIEAAFGGTHSIPATPIDPSALWEFN